MKIIYENLSAEEILHMLPEEQIRHSENVGKLMEGFSKWLHAYAADEMYPYFSLAAYYHDIGKVCVLPSLLTKQGILTPNEYRIVQQHTVFAQELLDLARRGKITGIPEGLIPLLRDAAVYHHEWWNGKGYPFGLRGEAIPMVARATAICDSYDAMVSDRAYRSAYSHDYACSELERGAGRQFEPALVTLFLDHEAEILRMLDEMHASGE
ncbi:HD-GYP domain-containing protein [Faecalispora jeddahensis]|uniref:HD-GYP domain-containing protein n=1 Tax=Faecalispora jeddahensis TaxID=1414721 RepID=UPI001896B0F8|nr:HD domain-containing phosphohydrolase [Faecalispora jeddahensis]